MARTERQSFHAGIWVTPDQQWTGPWSPYVEIFCEADARVQAQIRFGGPKLLGESVSIGEEWGTVRLHPDQTIEGRDRLEIYPPIVDPDVTLDDSAIKALEALNIPGGRQIQWAFTDYRSPVRSADVSIAEASVVPGNAELYSNPYNPYIGSTTPTAEIPPLDTTQTHREGYVRVSNTGIVAAGLRAVLAYSLHQPRRS